MITKYLKEVGCLMNPWVVYCIASDVMYYAIQVGTSRNETYTVKVCTTLVPSNSSGALYHRVTTIGV